MDRIYEAYMGGMGNAFAKKTQKRIHWICSKVQGTNILDVGCSQGITAILLAREGLQVTGLDISEETIHCAKQYLSEEPEEIQSRVNFLQADFGCFCPTQSYDTVIMGEVLEHLLHPQVFVANASKFLKDNGRLIVTVPFGINDDPDHKQTFFYFELIHLLEQYFQITEKLFFGKWIGFVATKVAEPAARNNYRYEECLQVEQAFYQVEREHLNERAAAKGKIQKNTVVIQELQKSLEKAATDQQTVVKQMQDQNRTIEQVNKRNQELEKVVAAANNRNQELENAVAATNNRNQELENAVAATNNRNQELEKVVAAANNRNQELENVVAAANNRNQELENAVAAVNKHNQELEETLETANKFSQELKDSLSGTIQNQRKSIQRLDANNQELTYSLNSLQTKLAEYDRMLSQIQNEKAKIEKKYESLSRSKLGRLTLWFWGLKRRMRQYRKERN